MEIKKLKEDIDKQREININLFNSIPMPSHEDPCNKKAEPILQQWRDGSKKIKEMMEELKKLELKNIKTEHKEKKFINSYGEATKREITSTSYERANKKLSKDVLRIMGI